MEKVVEYHGLNWFVVNEDKTETLLFLKDSFTREQALKYFDSKIVNRQGGVPFNRDSRKVWWDDSYIRKGLNSGLLSDLDIADLNMMRTTVELEGEKRTTEDFVRLLRKEEALRLKRIQERILKATKDYWLMDTYYDIDGECAENYYMSMSSSSARLDTWNGLLLEPSVRPMISLKPESSENLIFKFEHKEETEIDIRRIIDMLNNGVDTLLWTGYYFRFCLYRNVVGPSDYMELLNVLGETLLKAMFLMSEEQIQEYDKKKSDIEEFLGNSKKLIISK